MPLPQLQQTLQLKQPPMKLRSELLEHPEGLEMKMILQLQVCDLRDSQMQRSIKEVGMEFHQLMLKVQAKFLLDNLVEVWISQLCQAPDYLLSMKMS